MVGVGAAIGSYQSHESAFATLPKCLAAGRYNYILQLVVCRRGLFSDWDISTCISIKAGAKKEFPVDGTEDVDPI